ncbi:U8-agatoxin-Ao1a-like [Limulus polyphemus]|uniref:U8-agatoxin-Ao1a-like n=1 Tax=Limulus polyphemus TaxID=6850 RepID=A0ABM1RXU9_LIMPO|nr:U8-agatoxin-Ao1a-like [Limulus polyphemus]
MRYSTVVIVLGLLYLADAVRSLPYLTDEDTMDDYSDNLTRFLFYTWKRGCVRRGSSCDNRPDECCYNSSCRCNLWGTNCRCSRMGLFQRWGK